jgi:uncharacterized DUF497 family protein
MEFEWDENKNATNLSKHRIDFDDAIGIFEGPVMEFRSDREGEQRWIAIGLLDGREIAVIYTIRDDVHRIISARRARKHERRAYRQAYPQG